MDPSPPTQEAATALSTTWRPGAAWAVDGSKVSRADGRYAGGGEHQPANTASIVGEAVLRADAGGAAYLKLRGGWYSLVGITTDDGEFSAGGGEFSAGLKLFGCSLYVLESGGGLRESYFDAVLRSDAWGNCNGEPAELLDVEVYIDWGSRALWFAVDAGPWRKAPRALPAGVRAVRAWAHSSDATDVFECRAVHEVDRTGPPAASPPSRRAGARPPLVGAAGTPVRRRQAEEDDDEVVVMEEESEVESSSQSEVESEVAVDGPEEDLESEQDAHELEQLASHFLRPHYEARAKAADEKDGGWSMGMRPRQKQARVLRLYDNRAGCRKLLATCVALEKAKKRRTLLGHLQAMDKYHRAVKIEEKVRFRRRFDEITNTVDTRPGRADEPISLDSDDDDDAAPATQEKAPPSPPKRPRPAPPPAAVSPAEAEAAAAREVVARAGAIISKLFRDERTEVLEWGACATRRPRGALGQLLDGWRMANRVMVREGRVHLI